MRVFTVLLAGNQSNYQLLSIRGRIQNREDCSEQQEVYTGIDSINKISIITILQTKKSNYIEGK